MESANPNWTTTKWKKKHHLPRSPSSILRITLSSLFISLLLFLSYKHISPSLFSTANFSAPVRSNFCDTSKTLIPGEDKFLWYAPHSGFSNQLSEFRNAVIMAAILNRTLIVPPVLDHHAVALGSCPKFRVLGPNEIRFSVWNHIIELIQNRRYVSIGDVIDLSKVISAANVGVIDFRVFISTWCGVNIELACSEDSEKRSSLSETLRKFGSMLSGYAGNVDNCMHAVDEDCRTTVWTYGKDGADGTLDSFQPDEQLKKKKKLSFVRTRRDVYKTLGPGSRASEATVLAFGSLFTAPYKGTELYIDIHEAPRNERLESVIQAVKFLPFVPEILSAGKEFASKTIKSPFFCAQLRLLDGQFKNHWKSTFKVLQEEIESLRRKGSIPIHVFVMTDLPEGNWTGTYLHELTKNPGTFKVHRLTEKHELVMRTAEELATSGNKRKIGFLPESYGSMAKNCRPPLLPDILLYIEETICSCASLGFTGTSGSTIAESIQLMRNYAVCSDQGPMKH